jgi:hypothetical protein
LMMALLPLNWPRVPSSEDNSVLFILCISASAGELNHLPAPLTCHLGAAANGQTPLFFHVQLNQCTT